MEHQGWKDSPDAVVDENGQQIDAPVAASEIQGYYYVALRAGAALLALFGDRGTALRLLPKVRRLRAAFDEAFWMPASSSYAMALGPDKQQIRSASSNPGHLLACGIVPPPQGRRRRGPPACAMFMLLNGDAAGLACTC